MLCDFKIVMNLNNINPPLVVIFGRTNVGKSTLFNCLMEKKQALVSPQAGTTRDSNLGLIDWRGYSLALVDTGGIMDRRLLAAAGRRREDEDIDNKVQKQARAYLKRAAVVLFLVDARDGLLPPDKILARELEKIVPAAERVILVANKSDSPRLAQNAADFHRLGLGDPWPVSALSGAGTGDLLDCIVNKIKASRINFGHTHNGSPARDRINIAIIGQPNVGKSSLLNALLGEERIIVSPVPHTTREPQDVLIRYEGRELNFIDTAGISSKGRKQAKPTAAHATLSRLSIDRSLKALFRADIVLLVLDITKPLTHQDAKLVEDIFRAKTSLVIVANKWDAVKDRDTKHYTRAIYDRLPFAAWAPVQFVSARTGEKIGQIPPLLLAIAAARKTRLEPAALNRLIGQAVKRHLPAKGKGTKHPHIYELRQEGVDPPQFTLRIGARDNLHFSYVRFIENRLREKYGFLGTPLSMYVEKGRKVHGKHE